MQVLSWLLSCCLEDVQLLQNIHMTVKTIFIPRSSVKPMQLCVLYEGLGRRWWKNIVATHTPEDSLMTASRSHSLKLGSWSPQCKQKKKEISCMCKWFQMNYGQPTWQSKSTCACRMRYGNETNSSLLGEVWEWDKFLSIGWGMGMRLIPQYWVRYGNETNSSVSDEVWEWD